MIYLKWNKTSRSAYDEMGDCDEDRMNKLEQVGEWQEILEQRGYEIDAVIERASQRGLGSWISVLTAM